MNLKMIARVVMMAAMLASSRAVAPHKREPRNPLHAHLHHGREHQADVVQGNIHGHAYHHHGHDPRNARECGDPIKAAVHGSIDQLVEALDCGADVDEQDAGGNTALIISAMAGNQPMVKVLLERGANAEAANNMGQTALMRASARGRLSTLKLLLDKGNANVHAQDKFGNSVIKHAHLGHHEHAERHLHHHIKKGERRLEEEEKSPKKEVKETEL